MSCRALTQTEYENVKKQFTNPRDKLLYVLTHKTGYRITECLSLTIKDVLKPSIKVARKNMKFKKSGNDLVLTQKALGHSNIETTVKYLNVFQDEINSLILD
jgi:site-specific recombinase XerD